MNSMFYRADVFNQDISSLNVAMVANMDRMFKAITLSTVNYDALLIGWEGQMVFDNVEFDGGNSKYSPGTAAEARQRLIDKHGWKIKDGGEEL